MKLSLSLVLVAITIAGCSTTTSTKKNGRVLRVISGNNQSAAPSQFNTAPMVVLVTNFAGKPLVNVPVSFTVAAGSGLLATAPSNTPTPTLNLLRLTGTDGTAQAYYKQPSSFKVTSLIHVFEGPSNVTFQSLSVDPTDTDGNGLPDVWEQKYFGQIGVDPSDDIDGDRLSNLQEFQNGTDPTNYYNGGTPTITSLNPPGTIPSDGSISVLVQDETGNLLINAPVTFTAATDGHLLSNKEGGPGSTSVTVRTNNQGWTRAYVVPSGKTTTSQGMCTTSVEPQFGR